MLSGICHHFWTIYKMSNVNSDDFKNALGSWAAGVTIVTTEAEGNV